MIISVRFDCCAETWSELSLILIYQIENQVTIRHNFQPKRTVVKSTLISLTWFSVRITSSWHKLKKQKQSQSASARKIVQQTIPELKLL